MSGSEVIAAGVYVVRVLQRPPTLGDGLLPEQIFTLSSCLTELFPDTWALEWASDSESERIAAAGKFGVAEAVLPSVVRRVTDDFSAGRLGWPCVWRSLEDARAAVTELGLAQEELALFELGVPSECVPELLLKLAPARGVGDSGFYAALRAQQPLRAGGKAAGWELLGAELGGSFHSWLCNSIQNVAAERLGIEPGPFGLLATEQEVRAVAALLASGVGAEPVPWFPALLNRHPLVERPVR